MDALIINKKFCVRFLSLLTILIYIIFLFLDILYLQSENKYSIHLKYASIVVCFVISLLIGRDGYNKKDVFLVMAARFTTLIADCFLVLYDDYYLGILCFCGVQIIYIIRHTLMSNNKYRNSIGLVLFLLVSMVIVLNVELKFISQQILKISLIYAALLASSLYCAATTIKRGLYPKSASVLIAIGMFMFFLCDLNVGAYNIIHHKKIQVLSGFFIWFFYLPSQLLLSLSGFNIEYLKDVFFNKG